MDIISLPEILRFIFALIFVLSLMGGLALVMKKINGRTSLMTAKRRRLKITEILPLDSKRKAILLQRDNKEHLIILGANSETVIETGLESPQNSKDEYPDDQK